MMDKAFKLRPVRTVVLEPEPWIQVGEAKGQPDIYFVKEEQA